MDFSQIIPSLPSLWDGMKLTLQLLLLAVAGGIALGTVLALARMSNSAVLSGFAKAYVNYFRSIPLLLVITWFYFAVPFILRWITGEDTPIGAFSSCLVAFVMFEAAYFCEIVRAGIQAIPKGQMGASQALGMSYGQSMRLIILPQAFRKMTPLLLQQSIILFQDTSLVYTVGLMDFLNAARSRGDIIGQPMLAHKATHEGHAAAEGVAGHPHAFDPMAIPSIAYTNPEIAWVGLTEKEAKQQGLDYKTAVFPWAASGRAIAADRSEGKTKLIYDTKTDRLLGAGLVGIHAGERAHQRGLAVVDVAGGANDHAFVLRRCAAAAAVR